MIASIEEPHSTSVLYDRTARDFFFFFFFFFFRRPLVHFFVISDIKCFPKRAMQLYCID